MIGRIKRDEMKRCENDILRNYIASKNIKLYRIIKHTTTKREKKTNMLKRVSLLMFLVIRIRRKTKIKCTHFNT